MASPFPKTHRAGLIAGGCCLALPAGAQEAQPFGVDPAPTATAVLAPSATRGAPSIVVFAAVRR